MGAARASAVRVAASLGLLLYGWLAWGSGLDRLSAQYPEFERLVPGPLRARAERSAALLSARRQRPQLIGHAKAAVAADPVDPASTSLLGAAWLLTGNAAAGEQAFRVAARFGWRDVPTQAYWYEASMQARDMERAADRLDALLRAHPEMPGSDVMLARLEAQPAGRMALAGHLAARPGWLASYLDAAALPAERLARRSAVLGQVAAHGARLGCAAVAPFAAAAIAAGARRQAERVWEAHCPGAAPNGGITDAGFDRLGTTPASPFGWQVLPSGDVIVEPVGAPTADRRLRLSNAAAVDRLVLVQPLVLRAGRYRLSARTRPGELTASFACGAQPPFPRGVEGDLGKAGQVVEAPPCDRLLLGLWLRAGARRVELDDVRLEPAD